MIAVVEIGGKQYTVSENSIIEVDNQDLEAGSDLELQALLVSDEDASNTKIGTPFVEGSKVVLAVVEDFQDDKVRVFKMKAKKRYTRTFGFRASKTRLLVKSIA